MVLTSGRLLSLKASIICHLFGKVIRDHLVYMNIEH